MAGLYPLPKFYFQVNWGGTRIGFSEVSGLTIETKVIEYRDGAMQEFSKIKMPGMREYSNITLKRGVFNDDNEFYEWFNSVQLNTIDRRDLTISLLNESGDPVMTWNIKSAWPVKIESTDLKADDGEVAIESLEIAHEGLSIETQG